MSEFHLIDRIRRRAESSDSSVVLGIGDDAAILKLPAERELVICTDTLNSGVHFANDAPAASVGHKALAVNLSDLASMGATPRWALLSVSMPSSDQAWLDEFIDGFLRLASRHGVSLVGGDTCGGELSINVSALGFVRPGTAITRSGARPGDLVVVSGQLGDAGLACSSQLSGKTPGERGLKALQMPEPRIELGKALRGLATSCIDISDGLGADLGHLADASGCGAVIELERLPSSKDMMQCDTLTRWSMQLSGGDDYELCFTVPAEKEAQLSQLSRAIGIGLTVIGEMADIEGVQYLDSEGKEFRPRKPGYEHFA